MQRYKVSKVQTLSGHRDSIFALEQGPEPHFVISTGADGMVVLWDLSQDNLGKILAKIPASVYAIKYIPSDDLLLIGQNFDGIHLINYKDQKEINNVQLTKSYIFDIQYSDSFIFVAEGQGRVFILDRQTLKVLKVFDETSKSARSIAISNDFLIVGYSDNFIRIFDLKSFSKVREWEAHENSVFRVIVDNNGTILSTSRDARIKFWQPNGDLEDSITGHMYAINDICISPDQELLASCSMDKSIKIWDAGQRKLIKVIDKARNAGHGTSVNRLLWTHFNNYIVSCSDDRTLSVWSLNKD